MVDQTEHVAKGVFVCVLCVLGCRRCVATIVAPPLKQKCSFSSQFHHSLSNSFPLHCPDYLRFCPLFFSFNATPQDWRRRYFLLKGSKLFYSKNEWSPPHGMIDLAHCTTVKSADLKSKKRHSFEISTPEITYLLYADTEQEKDDWIGRVGKAIVRCSSTYYNNNNADGRGGPQQQQQYPTSNNNYNAGGPNTMYQHQSQQQQPGRMTNNNNPYQRQDVDDNDDDIYYEDPNNPNPYFND
jgi:hypothetical protein